MAEQNDFHSIIDRFAEADARFASGVAYVRGTGEPSVRVFGPTEKGGTTVVTGDARWHIGSISKTFTAALVMRSVERGVLDLNAPLEIYLPAYRDEMHSDWKSLTLEALLSHTSGLPANASRSLTSRTYSDKPYEGRRNVLSEMWDKPLQAKTGRFVYSNIGYVLAGIVIEEVTNKSWEELIVSEIARPFALTSLGFGAPQEQDAPRGHQSFFGFRSPVSPDDEMSDNPRWMGPAGNLHLNMRDLARWGQLHLRACKGEAADFLAQSSCQRLQSPIAEDYGLGWVLQTPKDGAPVVWHNGSNTMWYAVLLLVPGKDLVVAAATNADMPRRVDNVVRELSKALALGSPEE